MADEVNKEVFGDGTQPTETPQPEQEPQATEAPPKDDVFEGGKVYGGNKEEEKVPDEPEAEAKRSEAEERAAFFQTRYQNAMEFVQKNDPNFYIAMREQLKAGPAEPEPEPAKSPGTVELTDDEMADPVALLKRLESTVSGIDKRIEKTVTNVYRNAILTERAQQEQANVNRQMAAFVKENNITEDEFRRAAQVVNGFGIDVRQLGGPSSYANALVQQIQYNAVMDNAQGRTTEAEARVAEKVKGALVASQPTPGAAPAPRELTEEEKLLQQMIAVGSSDAAKDVFGD